MDPEDRHYCEEHQNKQNNGVMRNGSQVATAQHKDNVQQPTKKTGSNYSYKDGRGSRIRSAANLFGDMGRSVVVLKCVSKHRFAFAPATHSHCPLHREKTE